MPVLKSKTDSDPTGDSNSSEIVSLGYGVTSVVTGLVFVPPKVASQEDTN